MDPSRELREITIQGAGVSSHRRTTVFGDDRVSFAEWISIIDEIAEITPSGSMLRMIDFDLRPRSMRLIEYAAVRKRRVVVEIEAGGEGVRERLDDLGRFDLKAVSIPIDDTGSMFGDSVTKKRSWRGSVYAALWARQLGIPVEIRTQVRPAMVGRLGRLHDVVRRLGVSRWRVDLMGSGHGTGLLGSSETERAFSELIANVSEDGPVIELREGPSLRRSLQERSRRGRETEVDPNKGGFEIGTSRGQLFISKDGVITPGRSLPISVGHIRQEEIRSVLHRSDLLRAIHDPSRLTGKCGSCDLNALCGGSRARAWVVTGDPLAQDPGCPWDRSSISLSA